METEGPPANDLCSVCHGNFDTPCQANCSHWFCGNCVIRVWDYGSAVRPCKCPLCRRQITLLVPSEDSLRHRHDPEVAQILGRIETYNRLFGGGTSGLIQRMQDLPFLLRRLLRELMDPQRSLPLVIRARVYIAVKYDYVGKDYYNILNFTLEGFTHTGMILSAVYIISPVDIIPEGILGVVGLLDDLLIVLMCFLHVAAIYRSVLYLRHGGS